MKIRVECPNCDEILEVEIDDKNFEVISVESVEEESVEVSSDEQKELLNNLGIEFG